MDAMEFYTDPSNGEAMYRIIGNKTVKEFSQKDTEITEYVLKISEVFYPEQHKALNEIYAKSQPNKSLYDFIRARRIINCCFGENDRIPDIDIYGQHHIESVKCPIICECKYYKVICQPKFNSNLSDREYVVMELYFRHVQTEKIAEKLFISVHTVNNHRRNALQKMGLHNLEQFQDYAHRNSLFGS